MREIVSDSALDAMIVSERKRNAVEVARQQTAEAIAACMPRVLSRLMDMVEGDDEDRALKACLALLNKHAPTPGVERVVASEMVDGEVVSEDMRDLREKLFREIEKKGS